MNKLTKLIYNLLILCSIRAYSQTKCEPLFNNLIQDKSSNQLLENVNNNFKKNKAPYVIENQVLYFKTGVHTKQKVSDISVIEPEYVFEYQDKSYHDYWKEIGGISKAEMEAIIGENAQAFGRGFYVSMSLTDSREYGDYLSVFRLKKPLIVLENATATNYINRIFNSKEHTNFLKFAGVSGIRHKATWLNIFDESVLGPIEKLDTNSLAYALSLKFRPEMHQKLGIEEANEIFNPLALISVKNVSMKVIGMSQYIKAGRLDLDKFLSVPVSDYTHLEHSVLISAFRSDPETTVVKIFQQKDGLEKIRLVFSQLTLADLNAMTHLRYTFTGHASLDTLVAVSKKISFFDRIFKLQDVGDIAKLKSAKTSDRIKWIDNFASTDKYNFNIVVKTMDDLRKAVQDISETKTEIRDESAVYRFEHLNADEFGLGLSPEQFLKNNKLFFLKKNGFVYGLTKFSYEQYYKASFEHLDIFNWEKFESIFTESEKNMLRIMLSEVIRNDRTRKTATKKFVELILQKLFDQSYFLKLTQLVSSSSETPSILALCSVFLSVAPLKQNNHLAVRLYYQYLIKNHFNAKTEGLSDYLKLTNQDSFLFESLAEFPRRNFNSFMWFVNRLWIVSADTQEQMIDRAIALTKSEHYGIYMKQIKALP